MSNAGQKQTATAKPKFPWAPLLLLILGVYVFWVLPAQLGPRHVKVTYEPAKTSR